MTKCTRRHLSSADAGTLLRRALLTTTSPASQHTEYLFSRPNAATGIVTLRPPHRRRPTSNLRQAISVAATAMAWDPSHPPPTSSPGQHEPREAWRRRQEIDGARQLPGGDDPLRRRSDASPDDRRA